MSAWLVALNVIVVFFHFATQASAQQCVNRRPRLQFLYRMCEKGLPVGFGADCCILSYGENIANAFSL